MFWLEPGFSLDTYVPKLRNMVGREEDSEFLAQGLRLAGLE
jgi:hypothetical protein